MQAKYQIQSLSPVVTMAVTFRRPVEEYGEEAEPISLTVSVDYLRNRVFFEGAGIPGIDYFALEQAILAYIQPHKAAAPEVPPDILARIDKLRQGDYQNDVDVSGFQEFTQ